MLETLKYFTIVEVCILLITSIYALVIVLKGYGTSKVFSKMILTLILLNGSRSIINLVFIFDENYLLGRISIVLVHFTLLIWIFLNLDILKVYAVLNPEITDHKIKVAKWITVLVYIILTFSNYTSFFISDNSLPEWIGHYSSLGPFALIMVAVGYDNLQAMYLTYLIYFAKLKTKQSNQELGVIFQALKRMVLIICALCVFDWISIFLYIYAIYLASSMQEFNYMIILCEVHAGYHSNFMLYVIYVLKELTFADQTKIPETFCSKRVVADLRLKNPESIWDLDTVQIKK